MMEIDPSTLDGRDRYRLMISCVVPRPIAWVSTLSSSGEPNLAPFSFFNGVSARPPIVMVSVGRRRGEPKDTAKNLLQTKEAVVHIAHRPLAEAMVQTAAEVAPDVDEFTLAGLSSVPSAVVKPARVEGAAIAMECTLHQHLEMGDMPMDVFFLEVVRFHLAEEFLDDGLPNPQKLGAVGRLGGAKYCDTSGVFEIERPG